MRIRMILWLALVPIILIVAKLATRYWIAQDTTASSAPLDDDRSPSDLYSTRTPEEKAEMLRRQVIAKIHWGARDQEVYEWLQERHGITGRDADELLAQAHRAKRKAVRIKSIMTLVISGCGLFFTGGFMILELGAHVLWLGWISDAASVIACACLVAFVRSLWLLLTGRMEGSVD